MPQSGSQAMAMPQSGSYALAIPQSGSHAAAIPQLGSSIGPSLAKPQLGSMNFEPQ
jgi:hypothetical protein